MADKVITKTATNDLMAKMKGSLSSGVQRSFLSAEEKKKIYQEDFFKMSSNWELRDVDKIRVDGYRKYKENRRLREIKGEEMSTSEDEYGVKKTGYELTPYMIEFNENTSQDYTKGYNPEQLDKYY